MLKSIAIITTLRCDLKCEHCLRGFPKERPDFPMELLDKLLAEVLPFGARQVGLTGGEPHLHPQFEQLIEKIVAYGYSWHFTSHGQRMEPYLSLMESARKNFSHVNLSMDGADEVTHDDIRKRKGAFKKVVSTARNYVEKGYRVNLNMVLNQKNKNQVEDFISFGKELGVTSIAFGGVIPAPWNMHLLLSDTEKMELFQQIVVLRENAEVKIRTTSSLHTRGGVNFCDVFNMKKLYFNSRGEMIFCCDADQTESVVGSLYENSLETLMEKRLQMSMRLQKRRLNMIAKGEMREGFDTCGFCNQSDSFTLN